MTRLLVLLILLFSATTASATICRIIYIDGTFGTCSIDIKNGIAIVIPTYPNPYPIDPLVVQEISKEIQLDGIERMIKKLAEEE